MYSWIFKGGTENGIGPPLPQSSQATCPLTAWCPIVPASLHNKWQAASKHPPHTNRPCVRCFITHYVLSCMHLSCTLGSLKWGSYHRICSCAVWQHCLRYKWWPRCDHGQDSNSSSATALATQLPCQPAAVFHHKIPPFWPADPEVCCAQVEAQFSTRNITNQRTWFNHLIAALATEIAMEFWDLILRPPDNHPYDVLWAELTKRTVASEQ